jgi:hypothetical protein
MSVTVTCTCSKTDQQAEYRWSCAILRDSSAEDSESFFVDVIREFHMRENWLVCSEHEYKHEYRIVYIPKIIRVYIKKKTENEEVRVLEVWL